MKIFFQIVEKEMYNIKAPFLYQDMRASPLNEGLKKVKKN